MLVLDGKLEGGIISVFFHTTGTTYDKKENSGAKK
jgi:hypothetical protein